MFSRIKELTRHEFEFLFVWVRAPRRLTAPDAALRQTSHPNVNSSNAKHRGTVLTLAILECKQR